MAKAGRGLHRASLEDQDDLDFGGFSDEDTQHEPGQMPAPGTKPE